MPFEPTPLTAKRVPKYLDPDFVDETPLTLDVAAPRQTKADREQCAMRVLTALHEATHFVAMVEADDPVFQVKIAPNPITQKKGCCGMVWGANCGAYEDEWFTTAVGSAVEFLLLNPPGQAHFSAAFIHDFKQAENGARTWYTGEVERGRLDGPAESHVAAALGEGRPAVRAKSFILKRWPLIDLCATAFLIYGDRKGNVGRDVIATLSEVVRTRLDAPWNQRSRSMSPSDLLDNLPSDVLSIWRKHSPHVDIDGCDSPH